MADQGSTDRLADKAKIWLEQFDRWLIAIIVLGLAGSVIFGITAGHSPCHANAAKGAALKCASPALGVAVALAISFGAAAVGAAAGFLFGLPRSLSSDGARVPTKAADGSHDDDGTAYERPGHGYGAEVNTNLERISNWLTTVIVGVTLTKLESIPAQLTIFGDNVEPLFAFGGSAFAIGAGLFFAIAGFLLTYVETRVKLSFVFGYSMRDNSELFAPQKVIALARDTTAVPPQTPPDGATGGTAASGSTAVQNADQQMLKASLADLKTPDEIIAWANAKIRTGDSAAAVAAYRDVAGRVNLTPVQQENFARALAATGNANAANTVIDAAALTSGMPSSGTAGLRQQISAIALRERLRDGLYAPQNDRGYVDSIAAGEALIQSTGERQAWDYLWLACAYGQEVRDLAKTDQPTEDDTKKIRNSTARAHDMLAEALRLDSGLLTVARQLYYPDRQIGKDDDLQSLRPELDDLLGNRDPAPVAES